MEKQKIIVQELSGSEPSAEATSALPDTPTLFKDPPNAEEWNRLRGFLTRTFNMPSIIDGKPLEDESHCVGLNMMITARNRARREVEAETAKQNRLLVRVKRAHTADLKKVGLRVSSFLQAVGHMVIAVRESQNHSEKRRLAQGCYQLVAEIAEQLYEQVNVDYDWTSQDFIRLMLMPETNHALQKEVDFMRAAAHKNLVAQRKTLEGLRSFLKGQNIDLPQSIVAHLEEEIPF